MQSCSVLCFATTQGIMCLNRFVVDISPVECGREKLLQAKHGSLLWIIRRNDSKRHQYPCPAQLIWHPSIRGLDAVTN